MALTEEQLEIISDALVPLFQYLEKEVIVDVAKRIKESLAYTRAAELKVESLQKLGYSPARIRKEAMKILNSDPDFRKEVAKNTLEHKKTVKKILRDIMKDALAEKDKILSKSADLSYFDDLRIWKEGGKELTDNSFLPQLVQAARKQTSESLKNISGTTGFKTISGFEAMENLYSRELDKAMIKVCTGTYTREQVVYDVVHNLAGSGLRTIDFASGYSMQLDTAVKMAVRTGAHQISGKIMDANIQKTGENLVYVSKHWGARNTGAGHANHEQWHGKVYFIKDGTDYSDEAERIGQDRITSLWHATGYSVDGSRENDPNGLYGYNCRHKHYPWFIGISSLPEEDTEPEAVSINGKKYDYYAVTQKKRSMERKIRALKREREVLKALNMDTTQISKKIKQNIREYEEFCDNANVKTDINRLRYESGTSDLKKTEAWKRYKAAASDAVRNTRKSVHYNPEYDYSISIEKYPAMVNKGLSDAARDVAEKGEKDRCEHMYLVDLETGNLEYYETNGEPSEVGYNFWDYLKEHPERKYAFVHNHNTDSMFSQTDIQTLLTTEQVPVMIAVRNDAIKYIAERKGDSISNLDLYSEYNDDIEALNIEHQNGIITAGERAIKLEQTIVYNALRDFTLGGKLIEQNGQRK